MNLSGVSITFSAIHLDPLRSEGWHAHWFTVTAWRPSEPWTDGRDARRALEAHLHALAPTDRTTNVRQLPAELWSNEAIAAACLSLDGVVRVNVDREGFCAEAWA